MKIDVETALNLKYSLQWVGGDNMEKEMVTVFLRLRESQEICTTATKIAKRKETY